MESPFARRFFFSLVFFLASKNSLLFHRLFLCLSLFSSSIYPNGHSTGLWRPDPETLVDNGKCSCNEFALLASAYMYSRIRSEKVF